MSRFSAFFVGLKLSAVQVTSTFPAMLLDLLDGIQIDLGAASTDRFSKLRALEQPIMVNPEQSRHANPHQVSPEPDKGTANDFQIGITLSGGVTCGAYSAGVMDFLFEALSEWENAHQQGDEKLPPWTVRIRNMVGSSAGAIVTTLAAASITAYHEPLPNAFRLGDIPPKNNILYRGWVSDFGRGIFDTSDLPSPDATTTAVVPIRSIFNAFFLRKQPDLLCENQVTHQEIPNWAKGIKFYLTVTRLQDVSCSFSSGTSPMLNHADNIGFTTIPDPDSSSFPLNLQGSRTSEEWQTLFDVAGASAAIPAFFPAVLLSRPNPHYHKLSKPASPTAPCYGGTSCDFHATDGGLLNNEPVHISRAALEQVGTKCGQDESRGKSWGALIMIDCNGKSSEDVRPVVESSARQSILQCVVSSMFTILRQATMTGSNLHGTLDRGNFSQYIISPMRDGRKPNETMLATGTLYGFGGMMDERIRHHDFALGRRNCQQFLREQFCVAVRAASRNPVFAGVESYADGREKVQIIPLVGTAAQECPAPTWPVYARDEQDAIARRMSEKVFVRLVAVLMALARNMGLLGKGRWWNRLWKLQQSAVRQVVNLLALIATKKIEQLVIGALEQFR